ncbi:MAG: tetratricopeptide repeat protein [Thermoanaerobaculia bacterium]
MDYSLTDRLQRTLGRTGDLITLDRLFSEALAREDTATVYLHYALGLSQLKDPRTEEMFKKAVDLDPQGASLASYAEWLLDNRRDADALGRLPKSSGLYYLHFLRGVALERQSRGEEARTAYGKFRDYSASFPAPARFRIAGSPIQAASGIHFDDTKITDATAINGLSYLIYGEAQGENYGGMLAEGWVVRARTLRGSVGNPTCPAVSNTGTTLGDKYKSVMCQGSGSQFNGVCLAWCSNTATVCSHSTSTDNAAYDVYYGYGPDPVSGHCPDGISQSGSSYCDGSIKCYGNTVTYRLASPLFNLGTSGTCGTTCAPTSYGKVCGNGGLDNCFFSNPNCEGVGRVGYTGTLSGTGSNSVSASFYVSTSGNFNGHLEGPESQDFDLYLQSSSSSAGPWTDVASSTRLSAVEEINYSGSPGYYRWRAYSYSGSGSFSLCTKHP